MWRSVSVRKKLPKHLLHMLVLRNHSRARGMINGLSFTTISPSRAEYLHTSLISWEISPCLQTRLAQAYCGKVQSYWHGIEPWFDFQCDLLHRFLGGTRLAPSYIFWILKILKKNPALYIPSIQLRFTQEGPKIFWNLGYTWLSPAANESVLSVNTSSQQPRAQTQLYWRIHWSISSPQENTKQSERKHSASNW